MPDFSIVIIARNEMYTLARLLDSVKPFLQKQGEVILLDTGSTDRTVDVAKGAGCQTYLIGEKFRVSIDSAQAGEINNRFMKNGEGPLVEKDSNFFNFGAARQYAASLAKHDFVFHLDASDVLLACDLNFIDNQIKSGANSFEYMLESVTSDSLLSMISFKVARFYDRRLYHWEGFVHEGLYANSQTDILQKVKCDESQLSARHIKDADKSRSFYANGLALNTLLNPDQPRWKHYLGRELYYLKWFHSAIDLLEQHASMDEAWNSERCESLCLAGACYESLGEHKRASECYSRGFQIDSSRREPLLRLAELTQKLGDYQAGADYAHEALNIPKTSSYIELIGNYTFRPHLILYKCLYQLGLKEKSRQHWEICLQYAPADLQFRADAKWFENE